MKDWILHSWFTDATELKLQQGLEAWPVKIYNVTRVVCKVFLYSITDFFPLETVSFLLKSVKSAILKIQE